ncbi:glycosyl transferase [Clostridia bacterium]|nr:glycosyl transferase [Clostridia bacterium]
MQGFRRQIFIDGYFYTKAITGVERYSREITYRLDKLDISTRLTLVVPRDCKKLINDIYNIKIIELNCSNSYLEYIVKFNFYVMKHDGFVCSFRLFPSLTRRMIMCIHDIRPIDTNYDSLPYKIFFYVRAFIFSHLCAKIVTISDFSKERIAKRLKIQQAKIHVIYCGYEHVRYSETGILDTLRLRANEFYLTVGSNYLHKNIALIYGLAKHSRTTFVITGKNYDSSMVDNNIKITGYLSDNDVYTLMKNSIALIHPSKYEGFGIPPLEALVSGAKVIVSDYPVMHEIFGDSVIYINPDNPDIDISELISNNMFLAKLDFKKYSWDRAASQWSNLLKCV